MILACLWGAKMTDIHANFFSRPGSIEVICGCMFSGKTEALITQIRRAAIAKIRYQVFKPEVDIRYATDEVASHNKSRSPAINVKSSLEILKKVEPLTEIVGIDEAQFFDDQIVMVAQKLAENGRRVIVAGLDRDADLKPDRWEIGADGLGVIEIAGVTIRPPVRGLHNLRKAMLALAVARECGVSYEDAAAGIASMPSPRCA